MPLHAESGTKTDGSIFKVLTAQQEVTATIGKRSKDTTCCMGTIMAKINKFIYHNDKRLTSSALCSLTSRLNHKTFSPPLIFCKDFNFPVSGTSKNRRFASPHPSEHSADLHSFISTAPSVNMCNRPAFQTDSFLMYLF